MSSKKQKIALALYPLVYRIANVWRLPSIYKHLRRAARWGKLGIGNDLSADATVTNLWALNLGKNVVIGDRCELKITLNANGQEPFGSISIFDNSHLYAGSTYYAIGGNIRIGKTTFIGTHCHLGAYGKGIEIGDFVLIASHCSMVDTQHIFNSLEEPITTQGYTSLGIVIEDDVWLGAGVTVMDGVRIGKGSVVGAGSVVTKSIPPYSVAVGVPAKVIKSRQSVPEVSEYAVVGRPEAVVSE